MDKENEDETAVAVPVVSGNHRDRSPLVEITTQIRADQALALELLENAGRQRSAKDFDKAQLIQEALDLLIARSFVAIRLPKNTNQPGNREELQTK